ncbi:MAG: energy-coupling factor transporter transmembrane component T [Nitrospirota bacterium]
MDLFLYLDRNTWLHRLDARAKVLCVFGIFAVALIFSDPQYLLAPTALVLVAIAAAGALANLRKIWLLLTLLFLYCLLLWPFFVTGRTPFFTVGTHILTTESVGYGVGMGLRLDVMLLGGMLLLSTTTIEEFALALQRLGLPAPMGFALSLAFRWVPSLIGSAGLIVQAQRSRGLDLSAGHVVARVRRYPPLIVPLIGHTLRQTRLLAMALESKGFGPGVHRHGFLELQMRLPDYLTLAVIVAVVGLSVWLRVTGYGTVDVRF